MIDANTPVLVGVGQYTVRDEPLDALSTPMDLMERAAHAAAKDAHAPKRWLEDIDTLVVVKSFREPMRNSPAVLAARLGATNADTYLTPDGGEAPQYLVNRYAGAIARGEARSVLLAGAEAMDNGRRLIKAGQKPDWREPADRDATWLYPERPMASAYEEAHGIWIASHVYPLFENALRHRYGHTIDEHQTAMGALMQPLTAVSAASPNAWFPIQRTAAEISEPGPANRYVSWPYTKFMCAMNQINQSAALLLTSVGHARTSGIPEERWVYLHGAGDVQDIWHVSERSAYAASPAMALMGERALAQAGLEISDISYFDLYSCFPSAVAIGRDALGLSPNDPRPLTVTGGLPYHGGAGNNYSMNAVATMADQLRAEPGSFGMVTANGGYLTKHAAGIYSTMPVSGPWHRESPATYQRQIDRLPRPPLLEAPTGQGMIETYTVTYGRDGVPNRGIIIGRMGDINDPSTPRFLANAPADAATLTAMTETDFIGTSGAVSRQGDINLFTPD
ncbi:MAG: acetyl-CoA acetyltransferase [Alphaproteobacteria bacterium]|jgi:acetyl-CoA C-acetyltransferase|nr:acetyl-CoA acetyltransferase [Alphaproteobacteria bacterium]